MGGAGGVEGREGGGGGGESEGMCAGGEVGSRAPRKPIRTSPPSLPVSKPPGSQVCVT